MAWEWSHSVEAYQAVETNIRNQPRDWLETVYAEWCARDGNNLDDDRYRESLMVANEMTDGELADFVWRRADEYRTCENGGWLAHCCPFGCLCHMVSFDAEEE
jgi:hypothetical protein